MHCTISQAPEHPCILVSPGVLVRQQWHLPPDELSLKNVRGVPSLCNMTRRLFICLLTRHHRQEALAVPHGHPPRGAPVFTIRFRQERRLHNDLFSYRRPRATTRKDIKFFVLTYPQNSSLHLMPANRTLITVSSVTFNANGVLSNPVVGKEAAKTGRVLCVCTCEYRY